MELLTHLPWWVYLLALYLLKIGLEATRSKVVPMKKIGHYSVDFPVSISE